MAKKKLKIWDCFKISIKAWIGKVITSLIMLIPIALIFIFAIKKSFWAVIIAIILLPLTILVEGYLLNKLWRWT